ncbi:MAG: leucine-rich repeat domain-containing protein, partial [Ruminiclostridium sp.]|nr:leucine-rich repeat domain-containing protein [Ruminiclostridium sp.]
SFFSFRCVKSVRLPSSLSELGQVAFCDCAGLESVEFPKELAKVGAFVFQDCVRLSSVVLPENLRTIGVHFFKNCRKLESIELPDSVREIGSYAFDMSGLRRIRLPAGLEKVCTLAFFFCQKLERVEFRNNSTVLELRVFAGCPKLAAENVLQGLIGSSDITKAFTYSEEFDWNSALREDVFALALKYDSFALFDKEKILGEIVRRNLNRLLPLTEAAGWSITGECIGELLDISLKNGFVEITAWLLDYKNRKTGFKK